MRIAIPTFGTRVSPRFDCAEEIAVMTVEAGRLSERRELATWDWSADERVRRLLDLDVDTVLCGGIDRSTTCRLQSEGVTVYGWIAGEVEDALAALLDGALTGDAEATGGRCRGRCFPADETNRRQASAGRRKRRCRRGEGDARD